MLHFSYLLVLGTLCYGDPPHGPSHPDRLRKMPFRELEAYVQRLGQQRNFQALDQIVESNVPRRWCAVWARARITPDRDIIAYCSQFDLESSEWISAFWVLSERKKTVVIGYIKQVVSSMNPVVRATCYRVCLRAGWGDLLDQAKADRDCSDPLLGPGNGAGDTVGTAARDYILRFKRL
jgi:hypothetical protein